MAHFETLEIERSGRVATIWMNRPDVRNAFNEQLIAELTAACQALDADDAEAGVNAYIAFHEALLRVENKLASDEKKPVAPREEPDRSRPIQRDEVPDTDGDGDAGADAR